MYREWDSRWECEKGRRNRRRQRKFPVPCTEPINKIETTSVSNMEIKRNIKIKIYKKRGPSYSNEMAKWRGKRQQRGRERKRIVKDNQAQQWLSTIKRERIFSSISNIEKTRPVTGLRKRPECRRMQTNGWKEAGGGGPSRYEVAGCWGNRIDRSQYRNQMERKVGKSSFGWLTVL